MRFQEDGGSNFSQTIKVPDREPDFIAEETVSEKQAHIYVSERCASIQPPTAAGAVVLPLVLALARGLGAAGVETAAAASTALSTHTSAVRCF